MNKNQGKANIRDMTKGEPLPLIVAFGMPMLVGNIFQQFYNLVDSIVVGRFVGSQALAAVGTSGPLISLLIALAMGLTMGSGIVVSQLFGAKQNKKIKATVSTTLIFQSILAVVMTFLGLVLHKPMLEMIKVPAEIFPDAAAYMRIYFLGLFFLFTYNTFASILRALGDSKTPLYFLILSSLINTVLDLYFVVSLKMGVVGVAWATLIAQGVSAFLCFIYAMLRIEYFRFGKGEFVFSKEIFVDILRIGIPSSLQSSVVHIGFILMQNLINSFGALNMAAYTAASRLEGLSHLPSGNFTQALSTFVGQNMGAGQTERVVEGRRSVVKLTSIISIVTAAVFFALGPKLIGIFIDGSEMEVITRGSTFLKIYAPFLIFFSLMGSNTAVLRGSGDSLFSMICGFADLGVRVLAAYTLAAIPQIGFWGIAMAIPIGWAASALISYLRYRSMAWIDKTVSSLAHD
ncbi:MAG: MATE family efflux transporter [Firmicutes bacterium]|nr:MATE family efflux transporter [Bacillota bacterium]